MNTFQFISGHFKTATLMCVMFSASIVLADPPTTSSTVYQSVPPNISTSGSKPMLMLIASKDHTLFSPIYTDFEDLDGDGVIDDTFKENFKYYGYFDSTKCYVYSTSDNRFNPNSNATLSSGRYVCGGTGHWSGNFLNWSTMTRMDTVRKMMYGGERWVDSSSATILQAARLSTDSHSFVKHYAGSNIRDYTPFTEANLTKTTGQNAGNFAGLTICNTSTQNNNGDNTTNVPVLRMVKGNYRLWATVEAGGSVPFVCKWGGGSTITATNAPDALKRFGGKIFRYFGGTESYQGQAKLPNSPTTALQHEREFPSLTADGATYTGGPTSAELNARVAVCVSGQIGEERCKAYGTSSTLVYKPIGLLQDFGVPDANTSAAKTEFGLITGSYDKNLTAGALRKNMNDLYDEINPSTGQFCFKARSESSTSSNCPSGQINSSGSPADTRNYTTSGVIRSLDQIMLFGKNASGYDGSAFQQPSALTNGTLPAWGNPVGEMVVQALNYYAGLSSTNPTSTTNDTTAKMPVSGWTDPLSDSDTRRTSLYGKSICRPLNQLVLSSSALSFDHDEADDKFGLMSVGPRGNLTGYTNAVGTAEGISGVKSVGSATGGWGEDCTGKTVTSLSDVTGVCPVAPALKGSYKVAGAALYANTKAIRTITSPPPDLPKYALKVKTYAASLAGGSNTLQIPIPGTNKFVYLTPESLADIAATPHKKSTAAGLTFDTVSKSSDGRRAAFVVTWNNTPFGGDYDMDVTGFLMYEVLNPLAPSTKYRLKVTTDILNVGAGNSETHGFSVIGTNFDSRYLTHLHSTRTDKQPRVQGGAYPSLAVDPGNLPPPALLCDYGAYTAMNTNTSTLAVAGFPLITGNGFKACNGDLRTGGSPAQVASGGNVVIDQDIPISITFEMNGAEDVILRDPLWYAAKYGAFTPADPTSTTELPNTTLEWDARRNDGKPCGTGSGMLPCSDGEPDGYFLARRPELLEQQLRDTLETIISTTNAAPAVSSSQLSTGGFKYIATFEPSQNSGAIQAFKLNSAGAFSSTPDWDSGQKLTTVLPASRVVITNDGNVGKAWRITTTFTSGFTTALRSGSPTLTSTQGDELIDYLRGDRTKEKPAGIWRARSVNNIMGTVVNSSPWLQTQPIARNIGALPSGASSYSSFILTQNSREKVIWVGANDGMLHGFKADGTDGGTPVMSYIPSPMLTRLRSMAQDSTQIIAGMDGSPFAGDVLVGTTPVWRSYLFSSLGRGGRGVYALNVTANSGSTLATTLTESSAANIYKWMFSSDDSSDLGYVLGDHQLHPSSNQAVPVVRMNNGKYAVLVPNGLGSTAGRAYMFVLFVDGPSSGTWTAGTHYVKLSADSESANGMVGVNWADTNNDGTADLIYGTDILGRLWKFDVSSTSPSAWTSAFLDGTTPKPLFTAYSDLGSAPTQRLPVTTSPVLTFGYNGIMVGFGTGRSISSGDFPDASKTQRFYSVFDRLTWGARALPSSNLATMLKRTVVRTSDGTGAYISEAGSTAFSPATHDGWYINFAALGSGSTTNNELVLSSPKPIGGQIFFKTVRPTSASADMCYANPESMDYIVDPLSGLPEAGLFGTVEVVIADGSTRNVRLIGTSSTDQKSAVVIQTGTSSGGGGGGGGTCTGEKSASFSIIGKDGHKHTFCYRLPVRRQWREIPGVRTDQ